MDKAIFRLVHKEARLRACQSIREAPDGYVAIVRPATRSLDQNALLWALLTDVSNQVDWYGKKLTPDDWKNVFSSSLRRLEVVPNLDGTGFVALGQHTSTMTKREFSDLCELILAFGSEHGVQWSEQAA
jgi:hypothetical protein